jgi:hypothetical protein
MTKFETVLEAAENWVREAQRQRSAEINAYACATSSDFDRMHEAEDAAHAAQAAFERALRDALRN